MPSRMLPHSISTCDRFTNTEIRCSCLSFTMLYRIPNENRKELITWANEFRMIINNWANQRKSKYFTYNNNNNNNNSNQITQHGQQRCGSQRLRRLHVLITRNSITQKTKKYSRICDNLSAKRRRNSKKKKPYKGKENSQNEQI